MCRLWRKVQDSYCSEQNVLEKRALYKGASSLPVFTGGYNMLYTAVYNISRCHVQSRYCCDSHPDQGCTKRVQPGKYYECKVLHDVEITNFELPTFQFRKNRLF